jgi:TRAP-type C4-dicarboxylate transport system permease small subunit
MVTLQIAFRILSVGHGWTEELSRYAMVWMSMVGAVLMIAFDSDVRLSFFIDRLPKKIAKVLYLFSNILIFVFIAVMVWFGFIKAFDNRLIQATSVNISMIWFYLAVPLCGLLMIIQLVCRLILENVTPIQKSKIS